MHVSEKKIEANRRNAQRSTGPRSARGKQAIRWSALRHGLLSQEVVLGAGEDAERRPQLEHLLAQLRADLRPRGALEEMLVEKVAVCYWRLRRVLRYEAGETRKRLDLARRSRLDYQAEEAVCGGAASAQGNTRDSALPFPGSRTLSDIL